MSDLLVWSMKHSLYYVLYRNNWRLQNDINIEILYFGIKYTVIPFKHFWNGCICIFPGIRLSQAWKSVCIQVLIALEIKLLSVLAMDTEWDTNTNTNTYLHIYLSNRIQTRAYKCAKSETKTRLNLRWFCF